MKNKPIIKILLGIISTVIVMGLAFYFFLFLNPLELYESNTLKWIPIFIGVISLYVSGWINRDTSAKWLPLLFIPFVIFDLFNYSYFPFILILFITGALTLVVTRKHIATKYKLLSWTGIIGVFIFHLFAQPLIVAGPGFGYSDSGELVNARVLWNFLEEEELKLQSHVLLDANNNDYDMINIRGKTYFVTFWATWCAPCIKEKPALEALKKKFADKADVAFIDISFDEDKGRWIEYLNKKKPLGLQLASKSQKETSRALGFAGIPMHFIVDSAGVYKEYKSFEVAQKVLNERLSSQ